jgi:hypothetical protein
MKTTNQARTQSSIPSVTKQGENTAPPPRTGSAQAAASISSSPYLTIAPMGRVVDAIDNSMDKAACLLLFMTNLIADRGEHEDMQWGREAAEGATSLCIRVVAGMKDAFKAAREIIKAAEAAGAPIGFSTLDQEELNCQIGEVEALIHMFSSVLSGPMGRDGTSYSDSVCNGAFLLWVSPFDKLRACVRKLEAAFGTVHEKAA